MVETAFAFPVLVLMALGLVQFALFWQAHNVVEAAVQDGARYGASTPGTVPEVVAAAKKRTREILDMGPTPVQKLPSRALDANGTTDDVVVVTVTGKMDTALPWYDPAQGKMTHVTLPLDATARVVRERFRPTSVTP
jgi:hypothetical protein